MQHSTLLFCSVLLYAPHTIVGGLALCRHPLLLLVALFSSAAAFVPLVWTGILFRALHALGGMEEPPRRMTTCLLLLLHFVAQNVARLGTLHICVWLQRREGSRGRLLVWSRFPLVPLSIAVGAGFALTSLLISAGRLLAEEWDVGDVGWHRDGKGVAAGAANDTFFTEGEACHALPRLVQSCFQQTFFSCGQVAWTVMLGQAYAAFQSLDMKGGEGEGDGGAASSEVTIGDGTVQCHSPLGVTTIADQRTVQCTRREEEKEEARRVEITELLHLQDLQPGAYGAESGAPLAAVDADDIKAQRVEREAAAAAAVPERGLSVAADAAKEVGVPLERESHSVEPHLEATWDEKLSCPHRRAGLPAAPPSTPPPVEVVRQLLVDSIFVGRLPAAVLTGVAALALHLLFILLPFAGLSHASVPSPISGPSRMCEAYILSQCIVTIVSVVWGAWIVHHERHPSAYSLVPREVERARS